MLDATKIVNILLYLFVRKDSSSLYEAKMTTELPDFNSVWKQEGHINKQMKGEINYECFVHPTVYGAEK